MCIKDVSITTYICIYTSTLGYVVAYIGNGINAQKINFPDLLELCKLLRSAKALAQGTRLSIIDGERQHLPILI